MDQPLAEAHTACQKAFEDIRAVLGSQQPEQIFSDFDTEFDRYKLWAENVGAGHVGHKYRYSLDYRLREASFYRDQVATFLDILQSQIKRIHDLLVEPNVLNGLFLPTVPDDADILNQSLDDCNEDDSPWNSSSDTEADAAPDTATARRISDSTSADQFPAVSSAPQCPKEEETELHQILTSIKVTIAGLYKLPIRRPAPMDRIKDKTAEETSPYLHFDILHVRSKFPRLHEQVATRLGKMITRRRQLLRYRKTHDENQRMGAVKLRSHLVAATTERSTEADVQMKDDSPGPIEPDDKPRSLAPPSQQGTNKFTVLSKATTTQLEPNSSLAEGWLYAPSEAGSDVTLAVSEATGDICVEVPPRPKEGSTGGDLMHFKCNYCSLNIHNVQSDRAWKKHVLKDLIPYVCTFPFCDLSDHSFESREDWYTHEVQHHRVEFYCSDHKHQPYEDQHKFITHMSEEHSMDFKKSPVVLRNFRQPNSSVGGTCNLCRGSTTSLKGHVSRHLEQLALFAISRSDYISDDDETSDQGSHVARHDPDRSDQSSNVSAHDSERSDQSSNAAQHDPESSDQGADNVLQGPERTEPSMSPMTALESRTEYTVGWIATLAIERVTATAMLDEQHQRPLDFVHQPEDDNIYVWGRIREHNVVVASPSEGVYGTNSVLTTIRGMLFSFPEIRVGLLVGIGAGIPRPQSGIDIRLGDVVVGDPSVQGGGVVQYVFGKTKLGDGSKRSEPSNLLPKVFQTALAAFRQHDSGHSGALAEKLRNMPEPALGRAGKPDFTYQGQENDKLFESTYVHAGGTTCDDCDPRREIKRPERQICYPYVHYGLIVSGDVLIKDATARDSIARKLGEQCFCYDMEAAGLMNQFPALVIRGISDYADSHRNDRWQRYAATTAAAYAKTVLEFIPARFSEKWQNTVELLEDDHDIRQWLQPPDPSTNFRDAIQKRHGDTGQWFLDSNRFASWRDPHKSFMAVFGIAGGGKTVLSSIIIDHCKKDIIRGQRPCLYFFFDFRDEAKQSLDGMIRTLLIQASQESVQAKNQLRQFYASYAEAEQPRLESLCSEFGTMTALFEQTTIILDALDEVPAAQRGELLGWIKTARANLGNVQMIVTSQLEENIASEIRDLAIRIVLPQSNVEADIQKYVYNRVFTDHDFSRWNQREDMRALIATTVADKAGGMFLWATYQLDTLQNCPTTRTLERTLESLPQTLEATYERILENIPEANRSTVIKMLRLLVRSQRPLSISEFEGEITADVSVDLVSKRKDTLAELEETIRHCSCLVTQTQGTLQLAHFTVKQFLTRKAHWFQDTARRAVLTQPKLDLS